MNTATTAGRSVVIEREFAHPPEKVWRALTQPELMAEWLMKNDFKPVVGHRFNFRAQPNPHWNGVTDCEVLVVEPHKRLSYSWRSSGAEAADGTQTVVTWTLTPTKGGTLLRMEHAGFGTSAAQDGFYQGAQFGWKKMVAAMEGVLARS
jgi:uncharacterized protein YndB with AHSA1/START domain